MRNGEGGDALRDKGSNPMTTRSSYRRRMAPIGKSWLTQRRRIAALVALVSVLIATACDKVPLTAPTESEITLFSSATFLPVNGTAEITASVIESAGTAVQNGTLVTFTSTVGTIEPREARTNGGKVTVRLVAGTVSGKAQVRAFSGGAQSEPLEISIGGAAVETLTLVASPATVPAAGGTAELIATVSDVSGNRIGGVAVSFSATTGTLSASSAVSDGNGEARTRLTTNQATDVTAAAGAKTATAKIAVVNAPVVSFTVPTTGTAGSAVSIAVDINASVQSATPLRSAVVDFGDGSSQTLGVNPGSGQLKQTLSHVFRSAGTYTVRLTVVDTVGQQVSQSSAIVIDALRPLQVTLTAPTATIKVRSVASFTVAVAPDGTAPVAVATYLYDFGDGTTRVAGPSTTHVYDRVGQRTVTVTVTAVDGRVGRSSAEIIVEP